MATTTASGVEPEEVRTNDATISFPATSPRKSTSEFRDFLSNYNRVSELCFVDCVWDFTTRNVKSQEERCAMNCMEKYFQMNQRVSTRFREYQMTISDNALAESKKSGATQ